MNERVILQNCYIEMKTYGNYVRVTAIDPTTGIEVYVVGPKNAGQTALSRAAKRKLEYVLTKRKSQQKQNQNGIIV